MEVEIDLNHKAANSWVGEVTLPAPSQWLHRTWGMPRWGGNPGNIHLNQWKNLKGTCHQHSSEAMTFSCWRSYMYYFSGSFPREKKNHTGTNITSTLILVKLYLLLVNELIHITSILCRHFFLSKFTDSCFLEIFCCFTSNSFSACFCLYHFWAFFQSLVIFCLLLWVKRHKSFLDLYIWVKHTDSGLHLGCSEWAFTEERLMSVSWIAPPGLGSSSELSLPVF